MATSNNNPLSAISYTNKDFRSLFNELLDLTKKLTYKWDPTITNESDPAIILLKLNAIIGDKNNYNIDKNILEAFPETVTQEVSARSMYKQLAYNMPWYQSATTSVSFKWIGEELVPGEIVTIPAFTMISDENDSVIYTLIEDVQFTYGTDISSGKVIQGSITELSVNGTTNLQLNNIDYNNRIYLNDYSVAENGIYISNSEEPNLGYWEKVENLQIEPLGERYYEFGIDSRSNAAYVEFPSDIETLIRAGLNIKYVISDGYSGNVASRQLTKFYEDVTITFREEELNLNEEVIQMYNPSATTDGQDPETVSEAYNSYRRVAGTFDTLVTLRDYINAIYLSGLVSNDLVSDRLTDIQSSYTIVTDSFGSGDTIVEYARTTDSEKNDMTPYDLKLYLLHNPGVINSISSFNSSFDMEYTDSDVAKQVESYIQSTHCMQHDYLDLLPNLPCLFRNVFPIKIKFIPQYQLSSVQIDSVKKNIIQALYDELNSREVNFGEEPDYNLIYDVVVNSDERIKMATIEDFSYTTYVTYWEKTSDTDYGRFKSIPISNVENDPWIISCSTPEEFTEAIKNINNPSNYTYIANTSSTQSYKNNVKYQYSFSQVPSAGVDYTFGNNDIIIFFWKVNDDVKSPIRYKKYEYNQPYVEGIVSSFAFTSNNNVVVTTPLSDFSEEGILEYSTDTNSDFYKLNSSSSSSIVLSGDKQIDILQETFSNVVYKYNQSTKSFDQYSTLIDAFRQQIITKSVLAGVTPLYEQDNTFTYTIDQSFDHIDKEVDRVTTDLVISPWGFEEDGTPKKYEEPITETIQEYTLKDNETIQFLAPSFVSEMNYSNYVLYQLVMKTPTQSLPEYYVASANNFSASDHKYNGKTIVLYIANPDYNYDDSTSSAYILFCDLSSDSEQNGWKYLLYGEYTYTDNYGDQVTTTPLVAWQKDKLTLYYQQLVYRITPDTEYKLLDGDSITFFYKEEDEDDAPYTYRCYKGLAKETETERSPIIRPSFTLNGVGPNDSYINVEKLSSSGSIAYEASAYSDYQKVSSLRGTNVLSGTKTIDIRRMNQTTLQKNERYYYIITNNIDESVEPNQYVMSFQPTPKFVKGKFILKDGTDVDTEPYNWGYGTTEYYYKDTKQLVTFYYDYTLKTDEYFIYTNAQMSEYEMLGTGSLIRLLENPYSEELPVFRCTVVDYEDIAMLGLQSFTEHTKMLSVNTLVREQQIYNLTAGDTVRVEIDKDKYNEECYPYFCTDEGTPVLGFNVEYATQASGTFADLPPIEIQDETSNWVGSAVLNLDTTYDEAQIIDNSLPDGATSNESKQSLQQLIVGRTTTEGEETFVEQQYYPQDPYNSNEKYNVLANVSLNKVGGLNIDVTYLDAYGERTNINLFVFELNPAFNTTPFSKTAEYGIRMNLKTDNAENKNNIVINTEGTLTSVTVQNIKLEQGFNYILGVRNTSQNQKFWLRYNNADYVECLNTPQNSEAQNVSGKGLPNGKYYFLLDNINREITQLQFVFDGMDEMGYLELDDLTKCVPNSAFEQNYGISPDVIEKLIPEYDYHGYFKYNVKVEVDKLIEDPLEAKTFFNENHVCNRYTIPQPNLIIPSDSSQNSKASSIDVINNR